MACNIIIIIIRVFCPRAGLSLDAQASRLQFCPTAGLSMEAQAPSFQFCQRQVFNRELRNLGCSFTRDA